MKKTIFLLAVLGLLFSACTNNDATAANELPGGTPTPTREGTWSSVIEGYIYDFEAQAAPIAGATIRYELVLSYFPEIQDGHDNQTETDSQGEFTLPVIMHDTDNLRVVVEADGYLPYEEHFVGMDLADGETLTIGLTPANGSNP